MLQSDSTMLVVGQGINTPTHPLLYLTISGMEMMCFGQKWLVKVRRYDPGTSRSLLGRWERLHFFNLKIQTNVFLIGSMAITRTLTC